MELRGSFLTANNQRRSVATVLDPATGVRFWAESDAPELHEFFCGALWPLITSVANGSGAGKWSVLRQRIMLSKQPTLAEKLFIKLGAKRFSLCSLEHIFEQAAGDTRPDVLVPSQGIPTSLRNTKEWTRFNELVGQSWPVYSTARHAALRDLLDQMEDRLKGLPGRRVGAVVLDLEGKVLAAAPNMPGHSAIWHAELLVMRDLFEQSMTSGIDWGQLRIVSTLKPCRFCAALCAELLWRQGIADPLVYYRHNDPGVFARQTVLDAFSQDRRLNFDIPEGHQLELQAELSQ